MIVTDLFESTTGSSEDTEKQVYQHMIRKIPEFMYTAATADVKKAISKAMSFGLEISVPDLATYAYGILKTKDLDEVYAINELSSDLLQRSAQLAKNKSNQAMKPEVHNALGGGYMNPLAKHYDDVSQKINNRAAQVGKKEAIKKIASPAVMRKIGMNEGDVSTSNLRTMYDLASMAKNYCDAEGQESLNELLRILKWYMDQAEQGVTESSDDNPVANAITRRILTQRTDLLAKYGPVKVMNAIDDVADFVGDVEEIGSSDVSGWIRQIEQSLQSMNTALTEFAPGGDDGNDGFSDETLKRLAAQWWNGDEDPRVEQTLMAAGWEIGQDEGYDDGGVFVVQAGDDNGNSYISWPATELESLAEGGNVFMPDIQNTPEYKAGFETGKLPVPYPEGTQQYASYYKGVIDKATPNLNKGVTEGLDLNREAAKTLQNLKNLALMKSALTSQQLRQAGRESMITDAINACMQFEQSYLQNKQQGNAIFVRALRDEIDNFSKGYPINSSMPEDNAPELGDLLQGKLGKLNFQQGMAEDSRMRDFSRQDQLDHEDEIQSRMFNRLQNRITRQRDSHVAGVDIERWLKPYQILLKNNLKPKETGDRFEYLMQVALKLKGTDTGFDSATGMSNAYKIFNLDHSEQKLIAKLIRSAPKTSELEKYLQDSLNEDARAKTDDNFRAYLAQRKAEKEQQKKEQQKKEQGVAEGWRDLFRSKSAPAASGATGSRSLSPTFSALIPNPATGKPYTNAELRALSAQQATATVTPAARTGGKVPGQISMTPNAIRKRQARKSVTTTAAAAPNPFGQMVNQLQNYKTSTGGQVRGTATGLKHTASPDNPNAVPAAAAADTTSNPFGNIANQLQNYKTSTGGQVRGTATGLRNTAKSNSTTTMPASVPAAKAIPKATPVARPNFAPQNAGYKSVNYAPNVKTGAAMPKPLGVPAPVARSATKVTSGGPTSDEKAKLARRIAQAVKEPVAEMLQMVETKEDVQRIKKFIDNTFVKYGAVNESAFVIRNQILEHVTQVGAQRRRDFAAQQAQ